MQPYFFPYIGQFNLILASDRFLLCDDVQYIRKGWMNRNRILSPQLGVDYITVPVAKHSSKEVIRNIEIANDSDWKRKIGNQLLHYSKAPYYKEVRELVLDTINANVSSLSELNGICFEVTCSYIGIPYKKEYTSSFHIDYTSIEKVEDWALCYCKYFNANEYLNPPGGMGLYNTTYFEESRIKVTYVKRNDITYPQFKEPFQADLSIIDVMMFNGSNGTLELVKQFQCL